METIEAFAHYLQTEEKSKLTQEKYVRDVRAFLRWLEGRPLCKEEVLAYKAAILERYAAASVNSMLSAINCFLAFSGRQECRVKQLRRQREMFASGEKELSRAEYERLLRAARRNERLCLLMQTIGATGIRVSEHRFITVEAARQGYAQVQCKGKCRRVLLPERLCAALLSYAAARGIRGGSIFVTRGGKPLDRSYIWAEMKRLCRAAQISEEKVFPHNLRHLFARTYYASEKDVIRLADLLGHSSIDTTRIYTMESGEEHRRQIERLPLLYLV